MRRLIALFAWLLSACTQPVEPQDSARQPIAPVQSARQNVTTSSGQVSAGDKFGRECASDRDCGDGLTCLTASSNAWFGGGVASGICTVECTTALRSGVTDPCAKLATGSVCVGGSQDPSDNQARAFCLPGCTDATSTEKCQGRPDLACATVQEQNGSKAQQVCLPTCRDDHDCASVGRVCDAKFKVCVDAQSQSKGAAVGAACDPTAPEDNTCAGLCIAWGSANDAQSLAGAFCTERCTLGAEGACGLKAHGRAACVLAAPDADLGDSALCAPTCDQDSDCSRGHCDRSFAAKLGKGVCLF